MAWKPIETAPKDGKLLLLYDEGEARIGYYSGPPWEWMEPIHDLNGKGVGAYSHVGGGWMTPHAGCVESCQWGLEPTYWDYLPDPNVIEGEVNAVDSQERQESHEEGRQVEGG